jgi:hypothetical protein
LMATARQRKNWELRPPLASRSFPEALSATLREPLSQQSLHQLSASGRRPRAFGKAQATIFDFAGQCRGTALLCPMSAGCLTQKEVLW